MRYKMKITKRQLKQIIKEEKQKLLQEANVDGTISLDEETESRIFMADVEEQMESLVRFVVEESERIGGGFRGPGIKARAFKLIANIIHDYR
tara:strand:- start:325 stop:600 length:276 start_codon:yes stop_codon:yes gene_type:complete